MSHQDVPRFTFIDLFAGIGGMRMPFDELGGECVFTSESDKFAAETYAANFEEIVVGDIRDIDAEEIPPHDILLAGFPCPGFSIAGVSKNNSLGRPHGFKHKESGDLFFEIERVLRHHQPKAFLLENVLNLVKYDQGNAWKLMKAKLENLGYSIHSKSIDANLVVPQHRNRIFIVGFKDTADFEFPVIEKQIRKLKECLEPDVDEKYTLGRTWDFLQEYKLKHREEGHGFGYDLVSPEETRTRTLTSRYYKDGSEILLEQTGRNPRRLTPRECARLMGFPEEFNIPVSDTQAYKQFGNAVVPPIVEPIAKQMLEVISDL